MNWDDCMRAILAEPKNPGNMVYGKAYAKTGIGMTGEARRVQAMYILGNISSWRGDTAKAVREAIKGFAKK